MYIYGKNVLKEKLNSNERIDRVYLSDKFNDRDIINKLKDKHIKYSFVPNSSLDRKVNGLHQGVVIEIDEVETYTLDDLVNNIDKEYPLIVVLDHLEDPHNFGAIIRTCEALGVDGIVIPNDRSVGINATVVKTSAGAISHIKIAKVSNIYATINKLKGLGYWIVSTDMEGVNYNEIDYKVPICLVIGNEGKGVSKIVKDNADYIATIPMSGKVNSLNASVSAGIIIAEIVLQRTK